MNYLICGLSTIKDFLEEKDERLKKRRNIFAKSDEELIQEHTEASQQEGLSTHSNSSNDKKSSPEQSKEVADIQPSLQSVTFELVDIGAFYA